MACWTIIIGRTCLFRTVWIVNHFAVVLAWRTEVARWTVNNRATNWADLAWWAVHTFICRVSSSNRDELSSRTGILDAVDAIKWLWTELRTDLFLASFCAEVTFFALEVDVIVWITCNMVHSWPWAVESGWAWFTAWIQNWSIGVLDRVRVVKTCNISITPSRAREWKVVRCAFWTVISNRTYRWIDCACNWCCRCHLFAEFASGALLALSLPCLILVIPVFARDHFNSTSRAIHALSANCFNAGRRADVASSTRLEDLERSS